MWCAPFVPHIFKVSSLVPYWMWHYVSADVSMMRSATVKSLQHSWMDSKVSDSWKVLRSADEPKDDSFSTRETEIRQQHAIQVAGNPNLPFYCLFFVPFWSSQRDIFSEIHLEIAFSCILPPHIFELPPQGSWFNNRSEGALKEAFCWYGMISFLLGMENPCHNSKHLL